MMDIIYYVRYKYCGLTEIHRVIRIGVQADKMAKDWQILCITHSSCDDVLILQPIIR